MQLYHIKIDFENVDFILVFTVFYGFESICMTMENVNVARTNFKFIRAETSSCYNFPGGEICLFHFFHRNYGFMYLLSLCWLLKKS